MLTKGVPLIRHVHVSTVCCYRLRERVSGTERKQNQGFGALGVRSTPHIPRAGEL